MNKVSHFHIPVSDMDRAIKFYNKVFGWNITQDTDSMPKYKLVITTPIKKRGPPKEIGGINGSLFKREKSEDTISIVIRVSYIDEYLEKIENAGCKIITKKTPEDGIGFHAEFLDTENNIVGLWEEKLRV